MKKVKSFLAVIMALIVSMSFASVAFAADVAEADATNGVVTGADAFVVGDSVTGKINSAEDVDYFTFTLAKAGLLTVTLEHAAKAEAIGTYFTVEILDETEKAVASFTVAANAAKVSSPAFGAAAGKYFVKITKGSVVDTTVEYKLTAAVNENALCEYESNDTREKATKIELSSTVSLKKYTGTIPAGATDVDYYKFSIAKPGYLYIFVENDANFKGSYAVEVETYTEGNNGMAEWKKFGKFEVSKDDATVKSPSIGVTGDSDYYISVTGTEGGYNLYVVFVEDKQSEAEYNDAIAFATELSEGGLIYGSAFDKNDADFYAIKVAEKTKYTVKVTADPKTVTADGQWKVTVFNAKNEVVTGPVSATKAKAAEVAIAGLEAGTYYVKVEGGDILNTNIYTIEFVNGGADTDNMSFKELLGNIKWKTFLDNFAGWIGQVNIGKIVKEVVASIVALFSSMGK
ncbi:MAG: hypothetical protein IKB88_00910 [Clostridia bacterium]|nr:hypothetical protein [Clostridia bacterium]